MADGKEKKKSGPEWMVRVPAEPGRLRRETAFLCNIRFKNDLPEIPCDPKLLLPPYNKEEIAAFKLTELEKDLKKDVLLEPDLGIPLHAWNIERYSIPEDPAPQLHPDDAALLESDEELEPRRARLRGEAAEVSWLLRTKYIAAEAGLRRGGAAAAAAAAAPKRAEEEAKEEAAGDSRESRLRQIEQQFQAAKAPLVHCKDPSLQPVEVLPVFPDDLMEGRHCVLATFDADPLQDVELVAPLTPEERRRMAQAAQLKSFKLATGKQFVAYLLPQGAPPPDGGADASGVVPAAAFARDHEWVREYNFRAKVDQDGTTLLFRFGADGTVRFHPFNAKLDLRKRKRQGAAAGGEEEEDDGFEPPEKVVIRLPGTMSEEAEPAAAAADEEAARQQDGAAGAAADEQQQAGWGSDEEGGGGARGGGGDADMADADGGGGGGGGGEDEWGGGPPTTNAALRDVFGSDDDDI